MTLVELLVAVGIFGILTAILLPIAKSARNAADSTKCLSNLRQLTVGCLAYGGDNDNRLVPICAGTAANGITWRKLIMRYLGDDAADMKVFRCPSSTVDANHVPDATDRATGQRPTSYGLNSFNSTFGPTATRLHQYIDSISPPPDKRATAIISPASTILLCDIGRIENPSAVPTAWTEKKGSSFGYAAFPTQASYTSGDYAITPRHGNKKRVNVSFYDGHVASLNFNEEILGRPAGSAGCLYDNN